MGRDVLVGLAALTLFDIAAATPAAAQSSDPVWGGFYIGGHAGYRWGSLSLNGTSSEEVVVPYNFAVPTSSRNVSVGGAIVGFQAGYNYMVHPRILIGVEGDLTWGWGSSKSDYHYSGVDTVDDGFTYLGRSRVKLPWQASFRGRLGYVHGPWLFYGTGGVAFARVDWRQHSRVDTTLSTWETPSWKASRTLTGWVVGGGAEYLLTENWVLRLEYLHERFGSFSVPIGFREDVATPHGATLRLNSVNKVRFAISFKF